jgi:hypothetical protein
MSFSKPIMPEVFLKLRAILDSKYNEYLLLPINSHRFADFAYGFLEKFDVDSRTKRVVEIQEKHNDTMYRRKKFLCCLFHPKIQNHNEIIIFREFLLGKFTEDEVFYYLSCRNLILRGPQLENYSTASDASVFIHYEPINRWLNILLARYSSQVQNTVLYHINLRKKKKCGHYCIESGYVLRALLEIYRTAKRNKLEKLKTIFTRIEDSTNNADMKFSHFR